MAGPLLLRCACLERRRPVCSCALSGLASWGTLTQGCASLHPGLPSCAASRLNGSRARGSWLLALGSWLSALGLGAGGLVQSTVLGLACISYGLAGEAQGGSAVASLRLLGTIGVAALRRWTGRIAGPYGGGLVLTRGEADGRPAVASLRLLETEGDDRRGQAP